MSTTPPVPVSVDDVITELTATEADENTAADALLADRVSLQTRLAAAIAASQAAGATTTQLASFQTLNTQIAAESTKMKDALAATVTPAALAAQKALNA